MGYYIDQILLELKKTNPDGTEEEIKNDEDEQESDYNIDTNEDDENEEGNNDEENDTDDNTNDEEETDDEANYDLDTNDDDMEIGDDNAPESDNNPTDDIIETNDEEGTNDEANYDLDTNDDGGEDDTNTDDLDTDMGGGGTDTSGDNNDDPDAKIKEIENSINSLNPEQAKLQNINLKKQYLELYNNCGNFIDRLNDINKNEDNEEEINYSIQTIMELKKMIFEYLVNVFDTKTYTENGINYTEYLVTLNSISKLLKELNVKK